MNEGSMGGDERRGVRRWVTPGPRGSLGKACSVLVPGTVYVLSRYEPSSLILGAEEVPGGFNQGSEGSKSSYPDAPSC